MVGERVSIYDSYKLYIIKHREATKLKKKEILYSLIAACPDSVGPLNIYEKEQVYTLYSLTNDKGMYLMSRKRDIEGDNIEIVIKYPSLEIKFDDELFENFLMAF